jgi:outer membrane protein assembly factor BamA
VIPRFKFIPQALKENFRTTFAINANYTSRVDFFKLFSLNSSWGYEFNWNKNLLSVRIPNIEYSFLERGITLINLINTNQTYRYIFNDGLVSSVISSLTVTGGKKNVTNLSRFNVEASGLLTGLIRSNFLDSNLYRFIKLDADFRQTHTIRRSAFAWRVFAGAGYELPSTHYFNDQYLPFFKAYFAGGANSMRAWPLRKLGPGSAVKSFERDVAPDRFGDIQIEMNAEYRFYLTEIGGVKLNSVLFTDIGNIWNLRYNSDFPGGEFKFNKLFKDLAVGAGTGLRIDFGLFLVRVDLAYKLKDPSPSLVDIDKQNKFFPYRNLRKDAQIQLGVTYPF